jgi:cytochrome c556
MQHRKTMAASVLGLSLALVLLATLSESVAADDPIIVPKKIQESVTKMADDVGKGNKVDKDADLFFKDHKDELKKTMWVFKPREKDGKGGLGVGSKPGAYKQDGIEALILNQIGKSPSPLDLKTSGDDLTRLADITLAMAEISGKYTPEKKVGDKDPKIWTASNDDMKKAALSLKSAVKDGDKAKVQKAFLALSASCNRCHTTFRED